MVSLVGNFQNVLCDLSLKIIELVIAGVLLVLCTIISVVQSENISKLWLANH